MKGLLSTAAANGYRTGLVTTGDAATAAGLFYNVSGDNTTVASTLVKDTKFDFIGGGGRSNFVSKMIPGSKRTDDLNASKELADKGGTALFNAEAVEDSTLEIKGKTLALQGDDSLSYAADQNPERGAGLGDLASLALQTLAGKEGDAPCVLVIHDNLLAKAASEKDTPAFFGQIRELNGIVADVLATREAATNPASVGLALLATGGGIAPKFTSETAADRTNALYIVSQLSMSYAGAGAHLKGADEAKVTAFATDEYKGWKVSPEARSGIIAGTTSPESAIRASYEPAIAINFAASEAGPTLYTLDFNGDVAALMQLAATAPAK
jgi:hypothetical protein